MNPLAILPPWDSSVPRALRLFGEAAVLDSYGLAADSYSTLRFVGGAAAGCAPTVGLVTFGRAAPPAAVQVVQGGLSSYCDARGLHPADETESRAACQTIADASQEIVGRVPPCGVAVAELVRSIHVIKAASDDYDSSYSDPQIPFSVFVSVPSTRDRRSTLRVAEGLVHETMHLQLSLFEAICPITSLSSGWGLYSPWKREMRPTQGLIHGLYVFRVLQWMWHEFAKGSETQDDQTFAEQRVQAIESDICSIAAVSQSPDLTHEGRLLVEALLPGSWYLDQRVCWRGGAS